jgi:hypothetical protein
MAHAQMHIDLMGAYTGAGDAENELGGGGGLGFALTPNVNFLFHAIMGSKTTNVNTSKETSYEHMMFQGVIEYGYHFQNNPFIWASSIGLGMSDTSIDYSSASAKDSLSDKGFTWAVYTGMQWVATQHITPFFQVGYHRSMYGSELKNATIGGVQVFVGARVTLFGGNKSIMDEY